MSKISIDIDVTDKGVDLDSVVAIALIAANGQLNGRGNSALRPADPEDDLLVAAVRARLAGISKRQAIDLVIDIYATEWST